MHDMHTEAKKKGLMHLIQNMHAMMAGDEDQSLHDKVAEATQEVEGSPEEEASESAKEAAAEGDDPMGKKAFMKRGNKLPVGKATMMIAMKAPSHHPYGKVKKKYG